MTTPDSTTNENQTSNGWLSRSFTINWEVVVFIVILLLALFTRFYILGDRVMSHDESLHTRFSYNLYNEGNFSHTPLMHGPILFHANALAYYLFGDNDFSGRIYAAALGVILVMVPYLYRRWLGKWGTILASTMFLISPLILYYNRYIRHDTPSILSALLMIWAIMMYVNGPPNQQRRAHWLYIIAATMIWNLGSKETAFIYIAIIGIFLFLFFVVRLLQYLFSLPGKNIFYTGMIGILTGGVMSLGMYIILDIVKFDLFPEEGSIVFSALSTGEQQTFFVWTLAIVASVVTMILGTMFWAYREKMDRLPLLQAIAVIIISIVTCFGLVAIEELSHLESRQTIEETISWLPLYAVWALALLGFIILFLTRRRPDPLYGGKDKAGVGFWGTLDLFPEFDIIIVVGTLILPWATALIPFIMHGTPADFVAISDSLPGFVSDGFIRYLSGVNTPEQVGQAWLIFVSWAPLMALSIAIGLMWNWKRWLIASLIFHVIFAFFFTTVFTNIDGLYTGMIHSLGYWLEQQGERRGSQPQYYYLLIIMPIYEFLPVIGGVAAMFSGMVLFWRKTSRDDELLLEVARLEATDEVAQWYAERGIDDDDVPDVRDEFDEDELLSERTENITLRDDGELATDTFEAVVVGDHQPAEVDKKTRNQLIQAVYSRKVRRNPIFVTIAMLLVLGFAVFVLSGFRLLVMPGSVLMILFSGIALYLNRAAVREVDAALDAGYTPDEIRARLAPAPNRFQVAEYLDEDGDDKGKRLPAAQLDRLLAAHQRTQLTGIPFLIFFSWLAILNLVGYSLAGEKMPWLGTHLTTPLIFLTAWFFGRIFSQIDWRALMRLDWRVFAVMLLGVIAVVQVFWVLMGSPRPFAGLQQDQLQVTYSWLAYVAVAGGSGAFIYYYALKQANWARVRRLMALTLFCLLSVLTFRAAWMASFINYDYANEFLVYAHGAPAVKTVLEEIEELSLRTTDGNDIRLAYDNEVSWPYSWYFRNFDNAVYVGENPTVQNLEDAVVVVVGDANRGKVEPILEDRYQRFDHIRLWWPMQEYFNLNVDRVNNLLDFSPGNAQAAQLRQGIFEIWWARDYTTYGEAIDKSFSLEEWPVSDRMGFYVRKDVAALVWQYGVGDGTVENPLNAVAPNICTANWQPIQAVAEITSPQGLTNPIGMTFAEDGRLYVAEEFGHRVSIFDAEGNFLRSIGQQGTIDEAQLVFNRPNSVARGDDGNLYIADTWNFRIQVMDPATDAIRARWGQGGTFGFDAPVEPVDAFWGPRDVTVSADGLIYVSDTGNKRVRVYRLVDGEAVHIRDVGEGGSGPGQLDEPSGLVTHSDGRLFVADTWNRRISVFNANGEFIMTIPVRAWYEEQGNRPYLAIDEARDLLYVSDPDGGRVLVYTTNGDCVGSFGQAAGENATLGQFGIASGLAVDDDGFVYVSDSQLGRILKFVPFDFAPPAASEAVEANDDGVGDDEDSDAPVAE